MRAAVLVGGNIQAGEASEPPAPGPRQLLVGIRATGICGSDLSLAKDAEKFVRVSLEGENVLSIFDPSKPVVPGHEFAGVVEGIGDDVSEFAIGDPVTGIGLATEPSGAMTIIGYSNDYPGGFGQRIVIDADMARAIPAGLDFDAATLAEPLHVGETHVQQSGHGPQDLGLVIGAGTIGLGVVIALAQRKCPLIVVVEPSPKRRTLALELGAHVAVPPPSDGPASAIVSRTDGRRVIAYECSGRSGTIAILTRTLPHGSAVQVVASPFDEEAIVPVIAQWRQLSINFGSGPTQDPYGVTLSRLAAKEIDPTVFITGRVGIDGVAAAFESLKDPETHVKIVVDPTL